MQSRWDCKGLEQNSRTKAPYIPASTQLHDGHITFLNGLSNLPGEARTLNPWKYALSRFTSKCFEAYWYPASLRQEQATSTKTKKLWIFQFEKRWNCPDACRKNLIASPGGETQDQPGQKKTTNQSRRVLFTVLKPWKHHQKRLIAISFIPWKWWFKPSKEGHMASPLQVLQPGTSFNAERLPMFSIRFRAWWIWNRKLDGGFGLTSGGMSVYTTWIKICITKHRALCLYTKSKCTLPE